ALQALLLAGSSLHAQQPTRALPTGTELLRWILGDRKLESLGNTGALKDDPAKTILIILGNLDSLHDIDLPKFFDGGGAALIATDRSASLGRAGLGLSITGRAVTIPNDSPFAYRGRSDCVIVQPTQTSNRLFQGLPRLATNRPGFLQPPDGQTILKP